MLPLLLVPFQTTWFRVYSFVSLFGVICDHGLDVFPSCLTPFPLNGVHGHILHHERLMGNYSGPLSLWDYMMGTNMPPKQHVIVSSSVTLSVNVNAVAPAPPRSGCDTAPLSVESSRVESELACGIAADSMHEGGTDLARTALLRHALQFREDDSSSQCS
jgi:hypothetical protein